MNRSLTNWKKPGLRSLMILMLIVAVSGLSACGGGGGGNGGDDGGNGGNTTVSDNGFGILTISGVDTAQIGKAFSPNSEIDPSPGLLVWNSAAKLGDPDIGITPIMQLQIEFLTVSEPIGSMENVSFNWEESAQNLAGGKQYTCNPTKSSTTDPDPVCTGTVVRDTAANTVTFTDLTIGHNRSTLSDPVGDPITLNGTLKFTP